MEHTLVAFDGQDSLPFLAYVEADAWNGFTVAWMTLADLRAVTLDGGVTLFDSTMDAHLTYVEGEGIYEVTNVQSVPLESRVIGGETHYRMDGYTVTRVTLTPAAIEALSIILDVNDDDDIMLEAGVPMDGLARLREIVSAR